LLGFGSQVCYRDQIVNLLDGEGLNFIAVGGVLLSDFELIALLELLGLLSASIVIIAIVSEVSALKTEELCGFGSNDAL